MLTLDQEYFYKALDLASVGWCAVSYAFYIITSGLLTPKGQTTNYSFTASVLLFKCLSNNSCVIYLYPLSHSEQGEGLTVTAGDSVVKGRCEGNMSVVTSINGQDIMIPLQGKDHHVLSPHSNLEDTALVKCDVSDLWGLTLPP